MDPTAEQKFLDILKQPELEPADAEEKTLEEAFPGIDEETKEAISKIIATDLLAPEEIERRAKLFEHNRVLQAERAAKQQAKQDRRKIIGTSAKSRKRKKK